MDSTISHLSMNNKLHAHLHTYFPLPNFVCASMYQGLETLFIEVDNMSVICLV